MAESADFEGQGGKLDCRWMVGRGQPADDFLERSLVFADQATLGSPFLTAAKDVERSAAQSSELCQNTENGNHPGSIDAFAQMPAFGIAVGKQRRVQMEAQLVGPFETVGDPLEEISLRV